MTIEIKHTVDATDLAQQIATGIQQGLDGFGKSLEDLISKTPQVQNNKPIFNDGGGTPVMATNNTGGATGDDKKIINTATDPLITAITNLTAALKTAKPTSGLSPSSGFSTLNPVERQSVLSDLREYRAEIRKERAEDRNIVREERSSQRNKNIMYGALTGAAMAMVYQAGSWGATSGQSAQSVNAGTMNYNQFMSGYLNQKVGNSQSIASTAGIAGGAGIGLMIGGLPGLAAGAVIGGVSSYYANKTGEETKAINTLALNQDLASQQMQAMGLGKRGTSSLTAKGDIFGLSKSLNIPLTTLQSTMLNNKEYQGALPYVSEVALNARRDVMGNMTTAEQAKFISNSVRMGTLTGYSAGDVGSTVSHLSAVTGQDANKTLNELYKYQVQYGGDMKSNVSKIINIMQTTAMGKNTASQLVGEYQYNEPMLQQRVAQTKVTPTSMFTALAYKDIIAKETGITDIEGMKSDYKQRLARSQNAKSFSDINPQDIVITQLQQKMFAAMNIDPFVNNIGKVSPMGGGSGLENVERSDVEKAMSEMISDALNNISTESMTVNANNVIVNPVQTTGTNYPANTSGHREPITNTSSNYPASGTDKSLKQLFEHGAWDAKYATGWQDSLWNYLRKYQINRSGQGNLGKTKK